MYHNVTYKVYGINPRTYKEGGSRCHPLLPPPPHRPFFSVTRPMPKHGLYASVSTLLTICNPLQKGANQETQEYLSCIDIFTNCPTELQSPRETAKNNLVTRSLVGEFAHKRSGNKMRKSKGFAKIFQGMEWMTRNSSPIHVPFLGLFSS